MKSVAIMGTQSKSQPTILHLTGLLIQVTWVPNSGLIPLSKVILRAFHNPSSRRALILYSRGGHVYHSAFSQSALIGDCPLAQAIIHSFTEGITARSIFFKLSRRRGNRWLYGLLQPNV